MMTKRRAMRLFTGSLLGLFLLGPLGQAAGDAGHPQTINLYPNGPQPSPLAVPVGTAVLWVSHLAHTNLVVVTVTFAEGQRVAQATTTLQGYNGFVLEENNFIGRMEGNGGKVALRFLRPGTYTYTIDAHGLMGTVVVR